MLTTVKSVKTDVSSVSPSSAFTLCTIQIVTSEKKNLLLKQMHLNYLLKHFLPLFVRCTASVIKCLSSKKKIKKENKKIIKIKNK